MPALSEPSQEEDGQDWDGNPKSHTSSQLDSGSEEER